VSNVPPNVLTDVRIKLIILSVQQERSRRGIFFYAQNWLTGIHKVVIIDCLEYDYEQTRRTDIGPGLVPSDMKGVSVVHSVDLSIVWMEGK